jgi:hypothetical protein
MTTLHARPANDGSTTPAQRYCHADLVRIVGDAITGLGLNEGRIELAADVDLATDLLLRGRDILDVFEQLEEQLGLQLWPAMALDLVSAGASIGRLARLLAERLAQQPEGAGHA